MARTRSGFSRGHSQRRRVGWEAGVGGTSGQGVTTSAAGFLGSAIEILEDGLTLARTRGAFNAELLTATAAGDGFQGAIGIGIVTKSAIDIGITAVPTPITEQDWDGWLFWATVSVHDSLAGNGTQEIIIDSKAMRKTSEDTVFYAAFEVVEVGTATATFFLDSRMLFKLP